MWDLTPGTNTQMELPQDCTFETGVADLIEDCLHDLLSNKEIHVKHLSVDVADDMISIFAQWTDESDENPIVKCVKWGASLHRSCNTLAKEGNPLYLKPYYGKFGYGGPVVSMPLGRHALVSSQTKDSKKVYTLNLDRDALLRGSNWKTGGSVKVPKEDGISRTPHGSFTKVEISDPTLRLDISQLQCKLKDIYFPDIQYEEDSKSGETIMPVKFEANGVDLSEIQDGEVAITNMHSCNGPDFVSQLQSCKQDNTSKSPEFCIWGTTNFGFKRGDGITIGVDSRAAIQLDKTTLYTLSDDNKKFFQLSTKYSNLVCTAMGNAKEWHEMYDHLIKEIDILEVLSGPVKVLDAAKIAKHYMDRYIMTNHNKNVFGSLIAGWEEEAGFELVNVSIIGNGTKTVMANHVVCSIGYGAHFTGDMEKLAKQNPNMSAEDAAELVLKALFLASFSHGSSGGEMKVYNIGKGNYEEHYLMSALEHHYFHYGSVMDETCTLFLLYSKTDGHLFGAKLKELWPEPKGKLVAAHHVANYLDYHFHRLCFFSAQAVAEAYEHVEKFQCPAADPDPRLSKFLAMEIAADSSTQICVYVAKSSGDLLQYLMASDD